VLINNQMSIHAMTQDVKVRFQRLSTSIPWISSLGTEQMSTNDIQSSFLLMRSTRLYSALGVQKCYCKATTIPYLSHRRSRCWEKLSCTCNPSDCFTSIRAKKTDRWQSHFSLCIDRCSSLERLWPHEIMKFWTDPFLC
jgi:hypothetical protein